MYIKKFLLICCIIFLFLGCSKYSLENRLSLANHLTQKNHFQEKNISTDFFNIRTYIKSQDNNLPLKIYIEGDGFAWINRHTLSPNPTPVNPISLKLAVLDSHKNIAYIARPCQYITNKNCSEAYWSNKRFAKEVIDSMNQTISVLKQQTHTKDVILVGFSGGGAIAVLVASLRTDVKEIITIAGNLNHKILHKYHNISPMLGSLNPFDVASKISHIKQIHYIGEKDEVIPVQIVDSFKKASNNKSNIKIISLPNATHLHGWEKIFKGN